MGQFWSTGRVTWGLVRLGLLFSVCCVRDGHKNGQMKTSSLYCANILESMLWQVAEVIVCV